MIVCPNCQNQEYEGALFCSECGSRLAPVDLKNTQTLSGFGNTGLISPLPQSVEFIESAESEQSGEFQVSVHLIESGQVLNLSGRSEFTLGRVAEGQPILPDVDLSPYEAYGQGVSRLHAALKIPGGKLAVTDLGSSNGTRVNGQKIVPHVDYPINHGDIITLGKLRLQVLLGK